MAEVAPQIIWQNRLDGRFQVKVERIDGDTGRFTVTDSLEPGLGGLGLLADEEVELHYEARYGPDAGDVALWMNRGIELVDAAFGAPAPGPPAAAPEAQAQADAAPERPPLSPEAPKAILLMLAFAASLTLMLVRCSYDANVREAQNELDERARILAR